jgi:OOP family OmpA-OmpF porin
MAVIAASYSVPSQAALSSGFDAINLDPAISSKTDMIGVYRSNMVAKHGWHTGFLADYAKNPLEFGSPPGTRVGSVIDNMIVSNFFATYGILDWMSFGINIPIVFWNDVFPLLSRNPDIFSAAADPQTNLGDFRFEFKFRIINNEDKLFGLALLPFVTAPTGPSSTFAGNGAVTGGLKIILDFNIIERVQLALNVGALLRDDVTILNARIDDQLLLSLGLTVKIIERLSFILEGAMEPVIREFFDNEVETPAEVRGAFRIFLDDNKNWAINVGGGAGLTIGIGTPDWRGFLGLTYDWAPAPCPACEAPPAVEARKITIDQTIHFAFDRAVIRPQSYPILNDVVAIINANRSSIKSISIEGNTDSVGSDAYNKSLSDRRAAAVKDYLVKKGIPADMLETVGYGESRPVDTNTTAAGRAKNRRVEFKVTGN